MDIPIKINMSLYYKVREAREKQGLNVPRIGNDILEHPWLHKQLLDTETNKIYNVEKVWSDYYEGYFINALIENNGSHGVITIDNINSISDITLKHLEVNKKRYRLIN